MTRTSLECRSIVLAKIDDEEMAHQRWRTAFDEHDEAAEARARDQERKAADDLHDALLDYFEISERERGREPYAREPAAIDLNREVVACSARS